MWTGTGRRTPSAGLLRPTTADSTSSLLTKPLGVAGGSSGRLLKGSAGVMGRERARTAEVCPWRSRLTLTLTTHYSLLTSHSSPSHRILTLTLTPPLALTLTLVPTRSLPKRVCRRLLCR